MISIGSFSKICSVTTKTLRHYDKINLLKPSHINPHSGYRYYDPSQVKTMLLINKLKGYGMSLNTISDIIHFNKNEFALELLEVRSREILDKQSELEYIRRGILSDIKVLENGGYIMDHINDIKVSITQRDKTIIAFIRDEFAIRQFPDYFKSLFREVERDGIIPTGKPLTFYHGQEFNPERSDMEVAVPVDREGGSTRILQEGTYIKTIHKGSYDNLPDTYAGMVQWCSDNHYQIAGAPFDEYIVDCSTDKNQDNWLTNVWFPVSKA